MAWVIASWTYQPSTGTTPHRGLGDGFWRDFEMLVKVLIGRAGAKTRHADENPIVADNRFPALTDGCFHGDSYGRAANDLLTRAAFLQQKKLHARHRHDPRGNSAGRQNAPRLDRERDLRSGREDRNLGGAGLRGAKFIGARGA